MIPNSILVLNGKGGVLKTSVVANLSGLAAEGGWRVLAVDLDRQGNLGRDLGYLDRSDDGESLLRAVRDGVPLEPLRLVRPNLDVVPGGQRIDDLLADLQRSLLRGNLAAADRLGDVLAPVADDYDVVLIDSPPGEALLHSAAIRATHFILVPTQPDAASIDGLGQVASIVAREGSANPWLEVLGVVLGPLPKRASAIERDARVELGALLGDDIVVFQATIRDAKKAAVDCRRRGELVHEYEQAAAGAEPWWKRRTPDDPRFSAAASNLAEDYQRLTEEVFARYRERHQAYQEFLAAHGASGAGDG